MRYRRRRKLFRFHLKKYTAFNIAAVFLLLSAAIITLSFSRRGPIFPSVYQFLNHYLGLMSLFLPLILTLLALFFLRLKTKYSQPNVLAGIILLFASYLSLGKSGLIGKTIWQEISLLITPLGAVFVLFGFSLIALIIIFDKPLDEIFQLTKQIMEKIVFSFKEKLFTFSRKRPEMVVDGKKSIEQKTLELETEKLTAPITKRTTRDSEYSPPILSQDIIANTPSPRIWKYPPLSLLSDQPPQKADRGDLHKNAAVIEKTLDSFNIAAKVVEVNLGPAVTQYALEIAMGTKLSKITALSNDLALALAAPTGQIRIEAPIPGRSLVGIEIPNRSLAIVTLKQILTQPQLRKSRGDIKVGVGLDVAGEMVISDIAKMPHVLIAGTTGSGKSVLINSWIACLLFKNSPAELRLILVDPKRVELTAYNDIPHLLTPVIVEAKKIISALKWALSEMERRYKLFADNHVRNLQGFNELSGFQALPRIIIFIDELADLMAYAAVEVEDSICRLAQMARATGIHLVVSTQRPSVNVITGLIKANIPARIAFNVSSMVDSRVIIDTPGAEKLLGRGDMLYIPPDRAKPIRIQGTYISDEESKILVDFLKQSGAPIQYTQEVTTQPIRTAASGMQPTSENARDDLFNEAVKIVCRHDRASASLLQRRLSIGYARAARILDQLQAADIVGPPEGSKPREVLLRNPEEYFTKNENG